MSFLTTALNRKISQAASKCITNRDAAAYPQRLGAHGVCGIRINRTHIQGA